MGWLIMSPVSLQSFSVRQNVLSENPMQSRICSRDSRLRSCQDRFFTDLISMRGLGVRGWSSGKTEMLHSVVALPE